MSEEEQNWVQILQVMYEGTMAVRADSLAHHYDLDLKTPRDTKGSSREKSK
jgi:hypothetical protein